MLRLIVLAPVLFACRKNPQVELQMVESGAFDLQFEPTQLVLLDAEGKAAYTLLDLDRVAPLDALQSGQTISLATVELPAGEYSGIAVDFQAPAAIDGGIVAERRDPDLMVAKRVVLNERFCVKRGDEALIQLVVHPAHPSHLVDGPRVEARGLPACPVLGT